MTQKEQLLNDLDKKIERASNYRFGNFGSSYDDAENFNHYEDERLKLQKEKDLVENMTELEVREYVSKQNLKKNTSQQG